MKNLEFESFSGPLTEVSVIFSKEIATSWSDDSIHIKSDNKSIFNNSTDLH